MAYAYADQAATEKQSRIEHDAARIRDLAERLGGSERRITQHARKMGYFQDTPAISVSKIAPVSTTLLDAIGELERAVDGVSSALNVFD